MKKIKTLLMVFVVCLLCTACGNRTAITGDKFYEKTNKDYNVTDRSDHYGFATSAYELNSDNNLKILFIETKSDSMSQSLFVDETKNAYTDATNDLAEQNKDDKDFKIDDAEVDDTVTKGDNYSVVEINTSKTYYRITWIDNTVMIGSIDIDSKTTLLNTMKGLGY